MLGSLNRMRFGEEISKLLSRWNRPEDGALMNIFSNKMTINLKVFSSLMKNIIVGNMLSRLAITVKGRVRLVTYYSFCWRTYSSMLHPQIPESATVVWPSISNHTSMLWWSTVNSPQKFQKSTDVYVARMHRWASHVHHRCTIRLAMCRSNQS